MTAVAVSKNGILQASDRVMEFVWKTNKIGYPRLNKPAYIIAFSLRGLILGWRRVENDL